MSGNVRRVRHVRQHFEEVRLDKCKIEKLSEQDRTRLDEAVRRYEALTGEVVDEGEIETALSSPRIAREVTTIMAQIYRDEIRRELFGWRREG